MHSHIVVFLHVLSAFVWVGGMIAIRVTVHPALQTIEDAPVKLGKTLEITGRLFHLVIPFILILLVTGVLMIIDLDAHSSQLKSLYHAKEGIWTLMSLNFVYMYISRSKAWRLYTARKYSDAKEKIKLIPNLLLPVNILFGIIALWTGVSLRGL